MACVHLIKMGQGWVKEDSWVYDDFFCGFCGLDFINKTYYTLYHGATKAVLAVSQEARWHLGFQRGTRKNAALRVAFFQLLRRAAAFSCNGGALRAPLCLLARKSFW